MTTSYPSRDSGFTLIEVMVTIVLLGIMMAIAVSGWSSWTKASAHKGTAEELQSVLRQVQQRAVTEGRELRVRFDVAQDDFTVYRVTTAVDGTVLESRILGPVGTASDEIELATPSFDPGAVLVFNARGTASPGTVKVTRQGADPYVVTVEGLTGHVSIN